MSSYPEPLDLTRLKVLPLAERKSQSRLEDVLVEPSGDPPPCPEPVLGAIEQCARRIHAALERRAGVMLIYGAHLIKNGGQLFLNRLLEHGWVSHLATNGAGTIHDWEFAYLGRSTESVRDNVATGTFGTWDETGRYIQLALLMGGLRGEGYGRALGRFINQDGAEIPTAESLEALLRREPAHPLAAARADMLQALRVHQLPAGPQIVLHRWRNASVLAHAFRQEVPFTVHPGIGYDIITNHPMYNGAVVGRAAGIDFRLFGAAVETLDGGVVLSVGSAIDPVAVMDNIVRVTSHIWNKLMAQGAREVTRRVLTVIPTSNGLPYYQDGDGEYWRTFVFVERAQAFESVQTPHQAYEAAKAFGTFQNLLSDLGGKRLHDTIPDFHNIRKRFATLQVAIQDDHCNRAKMAAKEIEFALKQEPWIDQKGPPPGQSPGSQAVSQ